MLALSGGSWMTELYVSLDILEFVLFFSVDCERKLSESVVLFYCHIFLPLYF